MADHDDFLRWQAGRYRKELDKQISRVVYGVLFLIVVMAYLCLK